MPGLVTHWQNMVASSEVDDDLEPEIREEMKKYGQVASVVVFKVGHETNGGEFRCRTRRPRRRP